MPTYVYQCQSCTHGFEAVQPIMADPLRVCPECGQPKLARVLQPATFMFLDNDHGTVGSIAERNTRRVVKERGFNPTDPKTKPKPWWRSKNKVRKDILKNPRKYVETGQT